jgi:ribosomal-protein-alanine N-acetyltransferase
MQFQSLPLLDNPHFVIRPLAEQDIAHWAHYLQMEGVYEHTSWSHPTESDLRRYLGNELSQDPSGQLRLAIATRSENQLAGTVGFHTLSPINRTAELAYDLHPSFWGRGLAQQAGQELVRWAHLDAGIIRVQATVLESNARSIATLERMLFVREGLLRSYKLVRGKPGNFYMYAHVAVAQ